MRILITLASLLAVLGFLDISEAHADKSVLQSCPNLEPLPDNTDFDTFVNHPTLENGYGRTLG
ncbi:MAG: hypothetical protein AAFN91_10200, partial [Pseudomonadota bacterium]